MSETLVQFGENYEMNIPLEEETETQYFIVLETKKNKTFR